MEPPNIPPDREDTFVDNTTASTSSSSTIAATLNTTTISTSIATTSVQSTSNLLPVTATLSNPVQSSTISTVNTTTTPSASTMTAVTSLPTITANNQLVLYQDRNTSFSSPLSSSTASLPSNSSQTSSSSTSNVPAAIEKLSRPMAFDKMEFLVKEMQDPENGVPVRSQKIFLTSIPSAFMGYDLIEWLMERLNVEESEALNLANQLCQHGYFFPVSDGKTLVVKDDSSLYRFQTPYYWPWRQQKAPDQIEYAIYLAKRSLRNKQRHGLEDYETEALASLHKNLKGKWDFITMQAEEQIKLAKDRKKGDKIVSDSQERAYWRVHRPPPGQFTPLEPCPIPSRDRQGKPRKRTTEDLQREIEILKTSLGRNRIKMSVACESLVQYFETFTEYDPLMLPALPSNPWVTEDITFWQLNSPVVDVPTEKRVRRWAISIEELVQDPTGLQEFTQYLRKEYSHENIRFWSAVNDLRRSSHSQIHKKAKEIYEEFLEPGAPCEINIDGKTMEKVQQGLKSPCRFTFDVAAEHVYTLLLKKDCYPRFVRSDHYKTLLANAIQPLQKKRFFGFGGPAKKKPSTSTAPSNLLAQMAGGNSSTGTSSLSRRRGSDRSLSGSAHELAVCGVNKDPTKVPHSHSQSNLSEIPYRTMIYRGDMPETAPLSVRLAKDSSLDGKSIGGIQEREPAPKPSSSTCLETTFETSCNVCPWDNPDSDPPPTSKDSIISVSVCPWDDDPSTSQPEKTPASPSSATKPKNNLTVDLPSSVPNTNQSDVHNISEVSERMRRSCGLRQNTLDSDFHSTKRLAPVITEQRRASMTMAPRISEFQVNPSIQQQSSVASGISSSADDSLKASSIPDEKMDSSSSQISLVIHKNDSIEEEKIEPPEKAMKKSKESISESSESKIELEVVKTEDKVRKASAGSISISQKSLKTCKCSHAKNPSIERNPSISTQVLETTANKSTSTDLISTDDSTINIGVQSESTTFQPVVCEKETVSLQHSIDREIKSRESSLEEAGNRMPEDEHFKELTQQQISTDEDYEIAMASSLLPGCVAPAPTPAPSIAPLAEIDDNDEDDLETLKAIEQEPKPDIERKKKKREKKEKETGGAGASADADESTDEKSKRNAICPWEDEDVSNAVEAPFVKTYATLGYL